MAVLFVMDPHNGAVPTAENGTLGETRTPDTLLRTEVFYPSELRGQMPQA